MSEILGKNGAPLTDAEVDLFLANQPPSDPAETERIKARLAALVKQAEDIEPTPKSELLAALSRELTWQALHEAEDKLAEAKQVIADLRARLDAAEQWYERWQTLREWLNDYLSEDEATGDVCATIMEVQSKMKQITSVPR